MYMQNIFINPGPKDWDIILKRPAFDNKALEASVFRILADIQLQGDEAIKKYTEQFDHIALNDLRVSAAEFNEACSIVTDELKAAILVAKNNIEKFHAAQLHQEDEIETTKGVFCQRKWLPIGKIGLYIPG